MSEIKSMASFVTKALIFSTHTSTFCSIHRLFKLQAATICALSFRHYFTVFIIRRSNPPYLICQLHLMGFPIWKKPLSANKPNSDRGTSDSSANQRLLNGTNGVLQNGFGQGLYGFLKRFLFGKRLDRGLRTEEEDKVYSWLYMIAQTNRDVVFEYVRSTERGLSFTEAERRLKENGPNVPPEHNFPSWWRLLWNVAFHPFNFILIVLSALAYITSDNPNGCIMLAMVFISVSLRFYQEHSSSLCRRVPSRSNLFKHSSLCRHAPHDSPPHVKSYTADKWTSHHALKAFRCVPRVMYSA